MASLTIFNLMFVSDWGR